MYADLLVTTAAVTVYSKGGLGVCSAVQGYTVQATSTATTLVLNNGTNTIEWDASDVAGFQI